MLARRGSPASFWDPSRLGKALETILIAFPGHHVATILPFGIFISCNIDNLLLLMILFSTPGFATRDVVIGQFASQAILLAISLALASVAFKLSLRYIDLAGLLPLCFGVIKVRGRASRAPEDSNDGKDSVGGGSSISAVTLLMLSAGGDNLSVYVPIFASSPWPVILYFCAVFLPMAAAWCVTAHFLTTHALIGGVVRRYGSRMLPWNMIALGIYVLSGLLRTAK